MRHGKPTADPPGEDRDRPFRVEELLPHSPGLEAGLQVDEVLVDHNRRAAAGMGLEELKKLFRLEREEVSLLVLRGNQRIAVKIQLRHLI